MLWNIVWFVVKLFLACLASTAVWELCIALFDKKPRTSDFEDDEDTEDEEETGWEDTWWEDIETEEDTSDQPQEKPKFFHYVLFVWIMALSIYIFIVIIRL